jgi:hypothetical protein
MHTSKQHGSPIRPHPVHPVPGPAASHSVHGGTPLAAHSPAPSQNIPLLHATPAIIVSNWHEPLSQRSSVHGLPSSHSSAEVQLPVAAE